jgi:transposase
MSTSHFYHTQGIRGFKLKRMERIGGVEIACVESSAHRVACPGCGGWDTRIVQTSRTRDIRGLSIGLKRMIFRVAMRRVHCQKCGCYAQEPISFCPGPYARITRQLGYYVLALRTAMSISDVARFTGLHWDTVKDIEKAWLEKKYKKIRLNEVSILGIDEVYLGKALGYITIVRDLESGAVLYVGKGKGVDALKKFRKRIKRRAKQIVAVAMDMSNAYTVWVNEVLPDADIVYDHFHVIKLMNERMDNLRRSTMNKLEAEQKKELKNKRFLLLRNEESLSSEAAAELKILRLEFKDLGTASLMKEYLRNIYKMADSCALARTAFLLWCEKAEASGIHCLKQMAKTIRKRLKGLLAFWRHNRITSASQEGFNNKIGWLTRQAYGYRDERYLILKIYDLPHLSIRRTL